MDTTVWPGPLKFSLRATIDHHGSSRPGHLNIPVIIPHLSIVAKNKFYCNDPTITEFEIVDSKNSFTAYVIIYELIDTWFLDSNRRVKVWSLPWRWHIISIPLTTGQRNRRRNLWVGWCASSWWPLFLPRSSFVNIYIYICIFYMSYAFFGLPIVSSSLMIIV